MALAVGCNPATVGGTQGDGSEALPTEGNVSAMGGEGGGGGECPPPACSPACGHNGDKVRVCHHAPPDTPGSKSIEICVAVPGALAHLRQHDEDTLGCCPPQ